MHLSLDRRIGGTVREPYNDPVLRLWMEHHTCDWVVFALNGEQELDAFILISSEDGEERVELPTIVVGVHSDDPIVCVIEHRLISHLLQQVFWKA